ncbi:MAG: efflux RND transporter periplasmic adaptor subunit [Thiotrichales bacterium]|nr:efflux RND transporter periplasmic adaptor subunit [Thiotrichales bacterium]
MSTAFNAPLRYAATIVFFLAILSTTAFAQEKKPPTKVIVYQVQDQAVPQQVSLIGRVQAVETVEIRASVTETIERLPFNQGQPIRQGQVIAELNKQEEMAELKQAKIIAAEAKRQYERAQSLQGRGNITEATIDERKAQWLSAQAEVDIIEARLADRTLRAPFDGILGFKLVHPGALVNTTTLITTLDNTEQMYLDLQIPDRYIEQVKVGQSVLAKLPSGRELTGEILVVNPRIDESSGLLQIRALIENPENLLKSGMPLTSLLRFADQSQLLVPEAAILMEGEKSYVYRLQAASEQQGPLKVQKVLVETGKRYFDAVQIVAGLQAGDQVVSQGVMSLNPKSQVLIKGYAEQKPLAELLFGPRLPVPTMTQGN